MRGEMQQNKDKVICQHAKVSLYLGHKEKGSISWRRGLTKQLGNTNQKVKGITVIRWDNKAKFPH